RLKIIISYNIGIVFVWKLQKYNYLWLS
ncbi:unnamed protein product, partial [Allacma fusca]